MTVYHGSVLPVFSSFGGGDMEPITQDNVHLLLSWKVAGVAMLWAQDLGVSPLEALFRFYATKFYRQLEDESTKLWTYSPAQLYHLFTRAA